MKNEGDWQRFRSITKTFTAADWGALVGPFALRALWYLALVATIAKVWWPRAAGGAP